MKDKICLAIKNRKLIQFSYKEMQRIVEPHCCGVSKQGNDSVRAFQIEGESETDLNEWKLFTLSKMESLEILERCFSDPREGYSKGDKDLIEIYCDFEGVEFECGGKRDSKEKDNKENS